MKALFPLHTELPLSRLLRSSGFYGLHLNVKLMYGAWILYGIGCTLAEHISLSIGYYYRIARTEMDWSIARVQRFDLKYKSSRIPGNGLGRMCRKADGMPTFDRNRSAANVRMRPRRAPTRQKLPFFLILCPRRSHAMQMYGELNLPSRSWATFMANSTIS